MLRNPLLAPDLREYLDDGLDEAARDYLEEHHPAVIAELIADLDELESGRGRQALSLLEPRRRGDTLSYLEAESQVAIVTAYPPKDAAELLHFMPHDDRADLVGRLDEEVAEPILRQLAHAEREDIRQLSSYESGTAGAAMTTDYATLPPHLTVREALDRLRREFPDKETINLSYVVDPKRRLLGLISLPTLIRARPTATIEDIMQRDVLFARVDEPQGEVADQMAKYDLFAIPVLDAEDMLVGIITIDDAMDIRQREEAEDFLAFGGVRSEPDDDVPNYLQSGIWDTVRARVVPLLVLFVSGTLTGIVLGGFKSIQDQVKVLAFFVPLLIGTGGNAGSQTVGTVIRALALKQIAFRDVFKVALRESSSGLVLGLLLGPVGFVFAFVSTYINLTSVPIEAGPEAPLFRSLAVAGVLGASILGICVWSNLVGALVPLLADWLGRDPALISAPLISTLVDVTGLALYYSIAFALVTAGFL